MLPLAQTRPAPRSLVPKPVVNAGIVALGLVIGALGYYNRKTEPGTIAIGAGSSIVGAGIVLLVLDLAGFDSNGAS